MRKSRPGLTILTRITKTAVTLTASKRKTTRLETISRRRNAEYLLGLPEVIRLGNNNLIIIIRLIIRFYRFHPSLAARPRDYTVGKKDVYPGASLPIIISVKILILAF
jgi:hypothetical protein